MNILGYDFRPMNGHDYEGLAGAPEGALICESLDDRQLIYDPKKQTITEINCADTSDWQERVWKMEIVL